MFCFFLLIFDQIQKYPDTNGGIPDNWPWSSEYQDTAFGKGGLEKSNELYNSGSKSAEEPPRLAASAERLPIPMALEGKGKQSPAKKNLCKFKYNNNN